jgi:hypothetical protein
MRAQDRQIRRRAETRLRLVLCLSAFLLALAAEAQTGSIPQPAVPAPVLPSPQDQRPGGDAGGVPPSGESAGRNLSEQLSQSGGIVRPPAGVDPGMTVRPPETGSAMPVIPPPGTPGNNPSVQPK